jgi:hypothetical protein
MENHYFFLNFEKENPRVYQVGWTCYCVSNWFYWRWSLLFYVDLYENKIMKLINHAFGACHLHVQPKILHFVELSFWSNFSKLERQHNLVWYKKLRLMLLPTYKFFFLFWILLIPISFLFLIIFWHLDFWIMDSTMGIVGC